MVKVVGIREDVEGHTSPKSVALLDEERSEAFGV